tara:strand:+ start:373 stop:999 length:627 start_codon:yes stop_codon:yes gene_type:complete
MENIFFGFFTGGSLILAIGPQNLFVIEQGLKRNYVFLVTTLCALSDIFLIFLGVYIYHFFSFISYKVELALNILLILFLSRYIYTKYTELNKVHKISVPKSNKNFRDIIFKTLGFTYLNPHVYSDTVLILGNLSKNFLLKEKFYFALGASIASIIFFYSLGYLSVFFARFITKERIWRLINVFIIIFMSCITAYIAISTYYLVENNLN